MSYSVTNETLYLTRIANAPRCIIWLFNGATYPEHYSHDNIGIKMCPVPDHFMTSLLACPIWLCVLDRLLIIGECRLGTDIIHTIFNSATVGRNVVLFNATGDEHNKSACCLLLLIKPGSSRQEVMGSNIWQAMFYEANACFMSVCIGKWSCNTNNNTQTHLMLQTSACY